MGKTARSKSRNFPHHDLQNALVVSQKIADENAGRPMNRLLLADAIGISPGSSNMRDLLSSSEKYGLTTGDFKAAEIALTRDGEDATQSRDSTARRRALKKAATAPALFAQFFGDYNNKKLPSEEMFGKVLAQNYGVDMSLADACKEMIESNGRFVGMIRDISGAPHVLADAEPDSNTREESAKPAEEEDSSIEEKPNTNEVAADDHSPVVPESDTVELAKPKPIFIGHGKNRAPLEKLQSILTSFRIPHKVTIQEANLGRPIPKKVKDTLQQCGSAILIFTKDVLYVDKCGAEVWRPSENVVHELGAASYLFEDRIVIFKERGLELPSNFESVGYIEFDVEQIEAKTAELLKELIGFGLVRITPA